MANNATPISVPPSQQWDGNDGPWSSFSIHVGTPPQPARVLVSTTVGETWVISANKTQGGCLSNDQTGCPQSRGGLINVNNSRTWNDQGIFALGDEINLPDYNVPYVNGDYGLETLGLGLPGSNGVTLDGMVVAALATKAFYIGNLGVNQQPTNFTDFTNTHPSFLKSLKQQNQIPSLTYGYTAGNQYRLKKVFGSLTLGGYDTSKFVPTNNSFQFAGDISRDLVVGLQSVTYSDKNTQSKQLLSEGILAFVDATIPHIWLPKDACQQFEDAFGIEYNSTVERYLVNDTQHTKMSNSNATVSFVLGNQVNGGETVIINLPYAAFDLNVGYPVVNTSTRYFPLRRADNDTQYTLGRTFLQESYLIVDYERSNFSISPALFDESAQSNFVPIASTNNTLPAGVRTVQQNTSHSLSIGAIVGIVVAVVAVVLLAAAGAFFYVRRKRRKAAEAATKEEDYDPMAKPEMDGSGKAIPGELFGSEGKSDKDGSGFEMEGSGGKDDKARAEMEGTKGGAEMDAGHSVRRYAEMEGEGSSQVPIEMWAGAHGLYDEMDSPTVVGTSRGPSSSSGIRGSSGLRNSGGAPSPVSSGLDGRSGMASWARRQKAVPRLPGEESTDEISSQDELGSHRSSAADGLWSARRARPSPRSRTPQNLQEQDVSAPTSESSRERHRRGADALTRRLENASSRSTAPISSPSHDGSDRHDEWNSRFGSVQGYRSGGVTSGSEDISGPSDREDTRSPVRNWSRQVSSRTSSAAERTASRSPSHLSPSSENRDSRASPRPQGNFF